MEVDDGEAKDSNRNNHSLFRTIFYSRTHFITIIQVYCTARFRVICGRLLHMMTEDGDFKDNFEKIVDNFGFYVFMSIPNSVLTFHILCMLYK